MNVGRAATGIAALVPPGVAVEEWPGAAAGDPHALDADLLVGALPFEEREAIAGAVPRRRLEFALGRSCARRALAALGAPGGALPVGPMRQPVWPDGVVGSITHTKGYVAAAVASRTCLAGVGIDAEGNRPLPSEVERLVCLPDEVGHTTLAGVACGAAVFAAKESVFKAWYPLTGIWLEPLDVRITFNVTPVAGAAPGGVSVAPFRAALVDACRGPEEHMRRLRGAIGGSTAHVLAAAWIGVEPPPAPSGGRADV